MTNSILFSNPGPKLHQGPHFGQFQALFTVMSEETNSGTALGDSAITLPSDSESYSGNHDLSSSPPSSSSSPLVVYSRPTILSLLRGAAINLLLPFVNGLMLGFGELLAHEAAFRLGWGGTKVSLDHDSYIAWSVFERQHR